LPVDQEISAMANVFGAPALGQIFASQNTATAASGLAVMIRYPAVISQLQSVEI
jgi:hypothetical protein